MNKHPQVKSLKSSLSTRIKYDQYLKEKTRKSIVEKRLNKFRSYIQKSINKQEEEKILKSKNTFIPLLYEKEAPFNKQKFILSLNNISLEKSLKISKEHKENLLIDKPLMKSISYQIIDMAFEGYLYQKENEKDLLELPIFKNWNYKFENGIPIRPPIIDDDDIGIYQHVIGKGKFNWTIDNEREIFDYLNYAGEWDYTFIIPKNVLGKSIEFKDIYTNLSDDFEPTKIQIEDVEIPNKSIKNVKFSELISNVLENIFPDEYNDDNSNKEKGKWDYIHYKISLIGYPLSGRKTQANILKGKYPNLNIYSIYDIIKEKSNEWEKINEPIENHPKFKTMKPNQIENLKEEQNKKIEEFKNNNQIIMSYLENKNENKSPDDELLLKILIDKIEKDFIEKSEEEQIEEMVKKQTKLKELNKRLEELKIENETAKKPNLKEEQNIQNEIENIINESFKGFILTDFPRTISQCILLENYLTGYIDPTSKPKSQKDFVFDSLANILDIEYKPKTNNTIKKGGLDFIINLNVTENIVNERLKDVKYDPLTGKIYNESEINVNGKINIDKKIYERLVNEIPDFSNNKFELMKKEYNDNCSKIDRFYSNFGFYYENVENTSHKTKETIHLFQNIEIEEKEEISNFIIEKLLKILYKEYDRKEKLTYSNLKREGDEERVFFHLDSINRLKTQTTLAYKKESALILDASKYVYNKVMNFTQKYKEVLKKFIIFFDEQYECLCKRYDKVQRRFDKFLALGTDKKKLIKVLVNKYNDFIRRFSQLANHQYVYDEFRNDVEDLNNKLWLYVRQKQSECIVELNEIFSIKFCENEIKQFYLNIIEIFKIECEKFLTSFNIILKVYGNRKNEEEEKPVDFNILLEKTKPPSIFDDMDKYSQNINTIYLNCIKFILSLEERVKNLENYMKSLNALNDSNTTKHHHKRTLLNASINTTHIKLEPAITYEEGVLENIRKEKLKFKFRITVLKHFSLDYLERIFYTTQRVHNNMDSWIMIGVRLQNIALTKVKNILLKFIDEGKEIPLNTFDYIEMDYFDKEFGCYDQINYEHILGSRKRESHIHLDFTYDITCLEMAYHEMKKFEIENNIMSKYIFKEMFIKGIVFNRSEATEKPINAAICYPLKYLSYKDIMRLVDKFKVTFEHYNKEEINKKEVYEDYIDIGGIFTIISIIGSQVLSRKDKANIENEFKDKLIKGKYITKEDFKNFHFWFEDDEYLHKKEKQISIKDLLFDIWKDEKGVNMDLKSFIDCLSNEKHGGKLKDNILKIDYYNYALY